MRRHRLKSICVACIFAFAICYILFNTSFHFPKDSQTIIFLETSQSTSLTSRTACALESAARHHPNSDVILYSLSRISSEDMHKSALKSVPNIRFQLLNITEVLEGTPLDPWYSSGQIRKSSFPVHHLSDAVRLAILWKSGGIYMDTDMITFRPLLGLSNALGYEFPDAGNNGLIFDKGHPFIYDCMMELAGDYRGDIYNYHGPQLMTRVLKRICSVDFLRSIVNRPESCRGVTLLPFKTFSPHIYIDWKRAFEKPRENSLSQSYTLHLYSRMSQNKTGKPGDGSLLDVVAKQHCPHSYQVMVIKDVL